MMVQMEINLTNVDDGKSNMTEMLRSLPPDLIADILSRLPIEDFLRYRTICKAWYALTKDSYFINMHLRRALCLPRRIILESRVEGAMTCLYLIDTDGHDWRGRKIPIENSPGSYMRTLCSCQGLLCAGSGYKFDPLFIYNPITRECMELPKTNIEPEITLVSVGFGFDPSNKKYKVVRFFKTYHIEDLEVYMKGEIITLGESSWRELQVSHTVICSSNANPVFLDGALHWVIDKKSHPGCEQVLALDLCDEKFRTIKFPSSISRSIDPEELYLFNFRGYLSLVEWDTWKQFRFWRIERINSNNVYKFYQSTYSLPITYEDLLASLKVQDRLIDNSFLFQVVVHELQRC